MDSSLSKALIMIASVLLAMIVIAFITLSFRQIGLWATTKDDEILIEQKEKFNKEYEAYDKNLMYGVDVISCLNKALSNNENITNKYGEKVDASYHVNVKVRLKKTLQECIIVYNTDGRSKEIETVDWDSGYKLEDTKFTFLLHAGVSQFTHNTPLKTQYKDSDMKGNQNYIDYDLTYDWNKDNSSNEGKLRAKLAISQDITEIVKNTKNESKSADNKIWTKAIYRSALYDLKTRKFKCEKISYSDIGRVNYIEFKEF